MTRGKEKWNLGGKRFDAYTQMEANEDLSLRPGEDGGNALFSDVFVLVQWANSNAKRRTWQTQTLYESDKPRCELFGTHP